MIGQVYCDVPVRHCPTFPRSSKYVHYHFGPIHCLDCRKDIIGYTSTGIEIDVPVLNNIVPRIDIKEDSEHSRHLHFYYENSFGWSGEQKVRYSATQLELDDTKRLPSYRSVEPKPTYELKDAKPEEPRSTYVEPKEPEKAPEPSPVYKNGTDVILPEQDEQFAPSGEWKAASGSIESKETEATKSFPRYNDFLEKPSSIRSEELEHTRNFPRY